MFYSNQETLAKQQSKGTRAAAAERKWEPEIDQEGWSDLATLPEGRQYQGRDIVKSTDLNFFVCL